MARIRRALRVPGRRFGFATEEVEPAPHISPFAYRVKIKGVWHIMFVTHTTPTIKDRLTPEAQKSLFQAQREHYALRSRMYDLFLRSLITRPEYDRTMDYIHRFMLTPQKGSNGLFRLPFESEIIAKNSFIGKAIAEKIRTAGKTRRKVSGEVQEPTGEDPF